MTNFSSSSCQDQNSSLFEFNIVATLRTRWELWTAATIEDKTAIDDESTNRNSEETTTGNGKEFSLILWGEPCPWAEVGTVITVRQCLPFPDHCYNLTIYHQNDTDQQHNDDNGTAFFWASIHFNSTLVWHSQSLQPDDAAAAAAAAAAKFPDTYSILFGDKCRGQLWQGAMLDSAEAVTLAMAIIGASILLVMFYFNIRYRQPIEPVVLDGSRAITTRQRQQRRVANNEAPLTAEEKRLKRIAIHSRLITKQVIAEHSSSFGCSRRLSPSEMLGGNINHKNDESTPSNNSNSNSNNIIVDAKAATEGNVIDPISVPMVLQGEISDNCIMMEFSPPVPFPLAFAATCTEEDYKHANDDDVVAEHDRQSDQPTEHDWDESIDPFRQVVDLEQGRGSAIPPPAEALDDSDPELATVQSPSFNVDGGPVGLVIDSSATNNNGRHHLSLPHSLSAPSIARGVVSRQISHLSERMFRSSTTRQDDTTAMGPQGQGRQHQRRRQDQLQRMEQADVEEGRGGEGESTTVLHSSQQLDLEWIDDLAGDTTRLETTTTTTTTSIPRAPSAVSLDRYHRHWSLNGNSEEQSRVGWPFSSRWQYIGGRRLSLNSNRSIHSSLSLVLPRSIQALLLGSTAAAIAAIDDDDNNKNDINKEDKDLVVSPPSEYICQICLLDYELGELVSWSPNPECTHSFHTECIVDWLMRSKEQTCPACRRCYLKEEKNASSSEH